MTENGTHFIGGKWTQFTGEGFQSFSPAQNRKLPARFAEGGEAEVEQAATAAAESFGEYAALPDSARADFLRAVADEIEKRGDDLTAAAGDETALPAARLEGERGRTTGQLRMFAELIEKGEHHDARDDDALPERKPLPRPALSLTHRPLGPVAVFGASNFPLAFSVAGGDTAAALAAGCPVIVKGHPAHPQTSHITTEAIAAAMAKCKIPAGVFALIQGTRPELSRALVAHAHICAAGFTGSQKAGRALFDVAASRPSPIPFYAEMGSVNPVFVLPAAAKGKMKAVAEGWANSLVLGAGQFCTNPGVLFCPQSAADEFAAATAAVLEQNKTHTMLTPGIADAYRRGVAEASKHASVVFGAPESKSGNECEANAALLRCQTKQLSESPMLMEEIFGPVGIVAEYGDDKQLQQAAAALEGQLTATLWLTEDDFALAKTLLPVLERKAGRLICNGFPTGVEVASAMMHGGPYPAATCPTTSVGALAIRRFLRPVCRQNFPPRLAA